MTRILWYEVIPTMTVGEIMRIPYKTMKSSGAIRRASAYFGVRVRVYPSEAGGIELWRTK